ncbi:helix-turn-helix domain-containing protein [Macrococcoides caseolyticum]|uniref:helix-turn-helix domain-containing protein n=1 Tax=Macrococcoides caseolyticum TaxID=69966 RepID=UPI0024BD2FC3|nr:helix-turn-helix transcriptional regulator [Macrococcus caseolyticus]MDJ1088020.1 helix-turn-helix transcriptional regulator [Macrococcus caseolyticus]
MSTPNTISKQIIKLRNKQGWTQQQLAEKIGVSKQSVSNWETGEKLPRMGKIEEMANIFNVTVSYIVDGKSDNEKENIDIVKNLEEQGIIINFADYEGFEKLSDEEKLEFQKKIEEAVQFELFKRNNNKN